MQSEEISLLWVVCTWSCSVWTKKPCYGQPDGDAGLQQEFFPGSQHSPEQYTTDNSCAPCCRYTSRGLKNDHEEGCRLAEPSCSLLMFLACKNGKKRKHLTHSFEYMNDLRLAKSICKLWREACSESILLKYIFEYMFLNQNAVYVACIKSITGLLQYFTDFRITWLVDHQVLPCLQTSK